MTTNTEGGEIIEQALTYAALGWQVVPLHGIHPGGGCTCRKGKECGSAGKHPRIAKWQEKASTDDSQVLAWFDRWPNSNVGVALGRLSGIVDFEGDEGKVSEQDFAKLFDNDPPVCPTYKSSRGVHRLLKYREDLPGGAVIHVGAVEVRTGNGGAGAQSVFPPSKHASGVDYEWLPGLSPDDVDPPEIPEAVVAKLWNLHGEELPQGCNGEKEAKPAKHWKRVIKGVAEGDPAGGRNQSAAQLIGYMLRDGDVFDETRIGNLYALVQSWNATNHPPMDDAELQTTFESILTRERKHRTDTDPEMAVTEAVHRDPVTGKINEQGWSLTIIESDPKVYKLFSPLWPGPVILNTNQFMVPAKIAREAVEQKRVLPPKTFAVLWRGKGNKQALADRLLKTATLEAAPLEMRRPLVVAELFSREVARATVIDDDDEPDGQGRPCKLPSGDICFQFDYVWQPLSRGEDKVKRPELIQTLRELNVTERWRPCGGGRKRFKILTIEGQRKLDKMLHDASLEGE